MRCEAIKKDGSQCKVDGGGVDPKTGVCIWHDPGRREQAQKARKLGKRRQEETQMEEQTKRCFVPGELPELTDHASAKALLALIAEAVCTGKLSDRQAQAGIRAISEFVKTWESEVTAEVVGSLKQEVARLQRELKGKPGLKALK